MPRVYEVSNGPSGETLQQLVLEGQNPSAFTTVNVTLTGTFFDTQAPNKQRFDIRTYEKCYVLSVVERDDGWHFELLRKDKTLYISVYHYNPDAQKVQGKASLTLAQ